MQFYPIAMMVIISSSHIISYTLYGFDLICFRIFSEYDFLTKKLNSVLLSSH